MRRMIATAIIAMCVFLSALLWCSERLGSARLNANLVTISFVGFSTNDIGQKCLRYRPRNANTQGIPALSFARNGPRVAGERGRWLYFSQKSR